MPKSFSANVSLQPVESLHLGWVSLLKSLSPMKFDRTFRHPELGQMTPTAAPALHAWHSRHHEAHITALRSERAGKFLNLQRNRRARAHIYLGSLCCH